MELKNHSRLYFFFSYRGYHKLRGSLDYITNHLPEQLSSRSGARRIPALTVGPRQPQTSNYIILNLEYPIMVKPLTFKGDKKVKKRKRTDAEKSQRDGVDDEAGQLQKTGEDAENDDSWVSAEAVTDVVGPIMIVLPTDEPSALACDTTGKVFTIPIENIVDGNPATAEPHDVRQVWIANRVAGTENFRFKGHHGK
jgi:hypothetical protein